MFSPAKGLHIQLPIEEKNFPKFKPVFGNTSDHSFPWNCCGLYASQKLSLNGAKSLCWAFINTTTQVSDRTADYFSFAWPDQFFFVFWTDFLDCYKDKDVCIDMIYNGRDDDFLFSYISVEWYFYNQFHFTSLEKKSPQRNLVILPLSQWGNAAFELAWQEQDLDTGDFPARLEHTTIANLWPNLSRGLIMWSRQKQAIFPFLQQQARQVAKDTTRQILATASNLAGIC